MRPSLADRAPLRALRALLVAAALVAPTGCTLYAGQPWGDVEAALEVSFEPPAERLDDYGRLKTSFDYALEIERLALVLPEARVLVATGEAGSLSFDPAAPPPGYSLCHNGHCHHESGRLVEYEEIEQELQLGGGSFALVRMTEDEEVHLSATPWEVSLAPCEPDCLVPRGSLERLEVVVSEVRLRARVVDLRTGERARLEEGSVGVLARLPVSTTLHAPLQGRLDQGELPGVALAAALRVSETLFDRVDFAEVVGAAGSDVEVDLSDQRDLAELLAENLRASALDVEVERFELPERPLVLWPAPKEGEAP